MNQKTGKKYKGVTNALLVLSESLRSSGRTVRPFPPGRRSLANDGLPVAMKRKVTSSAKSQ